MPRRSRPPRRRLGFAIAAAAVAIAAGVAYVSGGERVRPAATRRDASPEPAAGGPHTTGRDEAAARGARGAVPPPPSSIERDDRDDREGRVRVTISGGVVDIAQQQPVGGVEVVFRSLAGENTTATQRDGSYAIRVPAGAYRAFVRDDSVLSIGRPDLVRLPTLPSAEMAGVPDEALMATVVARTDLDGLDLEVVRGGVVTGRVADRGGRAVAGAAVRARGGGLG